MITPPSEIPEYDMILLLDKLENPVVTASTKANIMHMKGPTKYVPITWLAERCDLESARYLVELINAGLKVLKEAEKEAKDATA